MLYATAIRNLKDDEKDEELRAADPDRFVAFMHRDLIRAGEHSRPVEFRTLAHRWPQAMVSILVVFVLLCSAAEAQLVVRDSTGRMSVVQVFAPTPPVSEPPRRSPAFDAIWRSYTPPRSTAAVRGYVSAPPAVWNPQVVYPWKR